MEPEITYYPNGNKYIESYWVNGKRHRLDGPAYIEYNDMNNNIWYERYYVNDKTHRLDGPAVIKYYTDGNIKDVQYWINGKLIHKEDINDILEQCNNDKQLFIDLLTIRYS